MSYNSKAPKYKCWDQIIMPFCNEFDKITVIRRSDFSAIAYKNSIDIAHCYLENVLDQAYLRKIKTKTKVIEYFIRIAGFDMDTFPEVLVNIICTYHALQGQIFINENQELFDNWNNNKKEYFRFYQLKFNILNRDWNNGEWLYGISTNTNHLCIAYELNTVWLIFMANYIYSRYKSPSQAFDWLQRRLIKKLKYWNI